MAGIFFSLNKTACNEITSTLNENGLPEITAPESTSDSDIINYLHSIDERDGIGVKQEKGKKAFRKKVKELGNKYSKELHLDFCINITLKTKTKKLIDWHVDVHGIVFDGYISLDAVLQFFPDELIDKLIHFAVCSIAKEYEQMCSRLTDLTVGRADISTGETISKTRYSGAGPKYTFPLSESKEKKIVSDFKKAAEEITKGLIAKHIVSA